MLADIFQDRAAFAEEGRATVEEALVQACRRGEAAHPELKLSREAFVRHLAARGGGAASSLEELDLEGLYLACACAAGDSAAHAKLDDQVLRNLPQTLTRYGDASFASEVIQEVRLKLLVGDPPKIAEFQGRGSLSRWVRAVAVRQAISGVRRSEPHAPDEALMEELIDGAAPADVRSLVDRMRPTLKRAVGAAFGALDVPDRLAVRMYFLEGRDLKTLAALHKTSVPTMSRRVSAARDTLLRHVRTELERELRVSPTDLESLLGAVGTKFGASLFSDVKG